MSRLLVVSALVGWAGATLLLSELRWFSRAPLSERLRPYAVGAPRQGRPGVLSAASFRDAVGPLSRVVGGRLARLLGVGEDLELRLTRIHAPLDATGFRTRQVGIAFAAFGLGALTVLAARPPVLLALLFLLGGHCSRSCSSSSGSPPPRRRGSAGSSSSCRSSRSSSRCCSPPATR